MRRWAAVLAAVTLLVLAASPARAQCAMCQTALTSSAEGRGMSEEFNRAILVMLFAPYAVFGTIGAILVRHRITAAWRRWRRELRLPSVRSSGPRVH